jgi:DNA polymerase-3 subunit delta
VQVDLHKFLDIKTIPNIVLLNGNGTDCAAIFIFLSSHIKRTIKATCNYNFIIERGFDYSLIKDILHSGNLFNEIRYIEVNYATKLSNEHQQNLINLINLLDNNTFLVIITDTLQKTDGVTIKDAISNNGCILNINSANVKEIIQYELQSNQLSIVYDALAMLLQLTSGSIVQTLQDIKKLILVFDYKHRISLDDVNKYVANNALYNVFKLKELYLENNLKGCLLVLDKLYNAPEDAILLCWLFHEEIKKLMVLHSCIKHKKPLNTAFKELKIWNSQQQLYQKAIRKIPFKNLIIVLNHIATLDLAIKGVVKQDIKQLLILIIRYLCGYPPTHELVN